MAIKEKSNKIKICFISVFAYPLFNPQFKGCFGGGGAELQMSMIAKELAKDQDFDIHFAVLDWGQSKEEKINDVNLHAVYRRGRDWKNLFSAPWQLFSALIKINPDIVVCRAAGVEVGISAIYARFFGKKMVYSLAHSMDLNGDAWHGARGKIFKFGLYQSDFLIAQSRDQQEKLKEDRVLKNKKNILIKNSLPLAFGDFEKDKKTILWVGRCTPEKQPELFLELAREIPDEKFVMIAPPNKPQLWEKISAAAKNFSNLEFIASVPFGKITAYYQQAKIFVNTSASEGFPNTFLQAAENVALIVSLNINPDNFLPEYGAGVFCGGDFKKMKENVLRLSKNEAERAPFTANALAYLKENHDIAENVKKWKDTMKSLVLKND